MKGTWNSHEFNILNSVLRDGDQRKLNMAATQNVDFNGAQNTIHKAPLNAGEIYGYPHFSAKQSNINKLEREKARPQTTRGGRKLSIVDKEGVDITRMNHDKSDKNMMSEYRSNFKTSRVPSRPASAMQNRAPSSTDINSMAQTNKSSSQYW